MVDGEDRLEPLGMGGVDHTATSDVFLEDGDQGQDGLCWQPLDRVVNESEVSSVKDAVQNPGVIAVKSLHQKLGQCVSPRRARGPCGGGGQKGQSLLIQQRYEATQY